ncbi:hypothetical protein CLV30_106153 [Haloactinopolyspora alba]|uniref:Uncharacterized protein n=1 Tax=Haloactinopolyspora alba TaxID=648780 RepID=A0A2P8E3U9_9ACTN|nr:hypothetical protein [Haloactinopolyspora alba]PSL04148.1 hypothetical protein CLV30_106153 [Haloactinopolyspora alba]
MTAVPLGAGPQTRVARAISKDVHLSLDDEAYDFHVELQPDYDTRNLAKALNLAEALGFEVIEPDECEAEVLPDGRTRIYLVPTDLDDE